MSAESTKPKVCIMRSREDEHFETYDSLTEVKISRHDLEDADAACNFMGNFYLEGTTSLSAKSYRETAKKFRKMLIERGWI